MKQLILAVLLGLVISIPTITSQTSGFSQTGKVSQELQGGGDFIAHSSLPLNSKAKVVNTRTGKEVEVTIIRQIPATPGRIADISADVAWKLDLGPDTNVKIYTSASGKPPPRRPRVATPAPAPAPTPSLVQTPVTEIFETAYDSGYDDGFHDGFHDGVYVTYQQVRSAPAKPAPVVVVETQQQQTRSAAVSNTRPQAAQPAPVVETRQQQARPVPVVEPRQEQLPPAVTSDIWAHVAKPAELKAQPVAVAAVNDPKPAQPAPVVETRQQAAQPAPIVETRTERTQTFVINESWPQTAKPSVVVDNSSQPFQPVIPVMPPAVIDNPPQAYQSVIPPVVNDNPPQAFQPVIPPAVVDNPQQASLPVMPAEIRTQIAPVTQVKEVVVSPGLPNPRNGKTYLLQVGAYASTDTAASVARQLISSGFKVAYEAADSLHRILVRDVPASMVYDTAQELGAFGIEEVWLRE